MNILYIHGFGSSFDPNSKKVTALKTLGNVYGIDIDWTLHSEVNIKKILKRIIEVDADLLVGTSMGGWGAATVGSDCGIPFVAINPVTNPAESLKKYIGKGLNYDNETEYNLTLETVESYRPIAQTGYGLILLDEGDDVISAHNTSELLNSTYRINMFKGGSHRFEHIDDSIPLIKEHYNKGLVSYGT